jgi:LytS/YehU family sensor histidine kinase
MPILSKLMGMLGGPVVDAILGQFTGLFKAYFAKEISEEELRAGMVKALTQAFADVEKSYAEAVTKTYASFMEAAAKSRLLQAYLIAVGGSQLAVLLWHQVGIPALCYSQGVKACYPSSGATVDWAYAIVLFTIGAGPYAFRSAAGGIVEKLGGLIRRK